MASGIPDRRQFLGAMATIGAMAAAGKSEALSAAAGGSAVRWPKLAGSPVLDSLHPVIEHSRDVRTNVDKIVEVAGWMAYEELPMPDYQMPFGVGQGSADDVIDFILTADCVDTAFTDFSTHVKFQVDYAGRHWSDSDGLFACMKRAMDNGIPILDGKFLAQVTRPETGAHFRRQHRTADARRKDGNLASGGRGAGGQVRRALPQFCKVVSASAV